MKSKTKRADLIPLEEALKDAFLKGMRLGFELGTLGDRVAPKLRGKSAKEIEGILQKEFDRVFK
jgi:hypothetical protein